MKKSFLVSIFSFFVLIAFSSCGDNGTNPSSNDEIWPLKVGNYWKYDAFFYDTLGNVVEQHEEIDKVVSDTIKNNEKVYKMINYRGDNIDNWGSLIKRNDGIYTDFFDIAVLLLWKYPVSKGEYFETSGRVWTVESINYNYLTNIGNFQCYHYTIVCCNEKQSFYFQPGVGCVAIELYGSKQGGTFFLQQKFVLKEYKVN